ETDIISTRASRAANERLTAEYLSTRLGQEFDGHITGMGKAGIFVRLGGSGADALMPMGMIGKDFYVFNEEKMTITGKNTKQTISVGDVLPVRLVESDSLSGRIVVKGAANDNTASRAPQTHKKPRGHRPS